jgi:dihydroflavonol-4-reductase
MTEKITGKTLVLGASGFLGSHVTKLLVAAGRDVRILVRKSSNTQATDHLEIERHIGDVSDTQSLKRAMNNCSNIFYCVVDTRAWLRDTTPLYKVNVDGLYNAMDAAQATGVKRFVFTSSFVTVGLTPDGVSDETDKFNWWEQAPEYIRCRVTAEKRFLEYCKDHNFPGIACCVGNTYGPGDYAPTPHGKMVLDSAKGKMPFYWHGGGPSVGIVDAAKALILAEKKGVIGERYVIAERWLSFQELFTLSAKAANVSPPKICLPIFMLYLLAGVADVVTRLQNKENRMSVASIKCSNRVNDIDTSKTKAVLGWKPAPIEDSIKEAVNFYLDPRQAK